MRGRTGPNETSDDIKSSCSSPDEHGYGQEEMSLPRLSVLKTKAEARALAETLKVWIVELPIKNANDILMYDNSVIPR